MADLGLIGASVVGTVFGMTLKHGRDNLTRAREHIAHGDATPTEQRMASDLLEALIEAVKGE